jgi:hypothetical protein
MFLSYELATYEYPRALGVYFRYEPNFLNLSLYGFKTEKDPLTKVPGFILDSEEVRDRIAIKSTVGISLAALREDPTWADYTFWAVPANQAFTLIYPPVNRTADTCASKISRTQWQNLTSRQIALELMVPHMGLETFEEAGVHLYSSREYPIISNVLPYSEDGFVQGANRSRNDLRNLTVPDLGISGPDKVEAGAVAEFTLHVLNRGKSYDPPVMVYLESDAGRIPRPQLRDVMGSAGFTLDTSGLAPGDVVTLKAGFKYWSGKAVKEVVLE